MNQATRLNLTRAQWFLVAEIDKAGGAKQVYRNRLPVKALIERGICDWRPDRFNNMLEITPNGYVMLNQSPWPEFVSTVYEDEVSEE